MTDYSFEIIGVTELDDPAENINQVSFWSDVDHNFRIEKYEDTSIDLHSCKDSYTLRLEKDKKTIFSGVCKGIAVRVKFNRNWLTATLSYSR